MTRGTECNYPTIGEVQRYLYQVYAPIEMPELKYCPRLYVGDRIQLGIFEVLRPGQKPVAVKVVFCSERQAADHIKHLKDVHISWQNDSGFGENILAVNPRQIQYDSEMSLLRIETEWAERTLADKMKAGCGYTDKERWEDFEALREIVQRIHSLGAGKPYHADVKPSNVFFIRDQNGKEHLKLGDIEPCIGTAEYYPCKDANQAEYFCTPHTDFNFGELQYGKERDEFALHMVFLELAYNIRIREVVNDNDWMSFLLFNAKQREKYFLKKSMKKSFFKGKTPKTPSGSQSEGITYGECWKFGVLRITFPVATAAAIVFMWFIYGSCWFKEFYLNSPFLYGFFQTVESDKDVALHGIEIILALFSYALSVYISKRINPTIGLDIRDFFAYTGVFICSLGFSIPIVLVSFNFLVPVQENDYLKVFHEIHMEPCNKDIEQGEELFVAQPIRLLNDNYYSFNIQKNVDTQKWVLVMIYSADPNKFKEPSYANEMHLLTNLLNKYNHELFYDLFTKHFKMTLEHIQTYCKQPEKVKMELERLSEDPGKDLFDLLLYQFIEQNIDRMPFDRESDELPYNHLLRELNLKRSKS